MRRPPAGRLLTLLVVMSLAFAGVVVRLVQLQVRSGSELAALGVSQRSHTIALPADRGTILDRFGDPLALSVEARDVYANPRFVTDPSGEAELLAALIGAKARDIEGSLRSTGTFVYVARQLDVEVATEIDALGLPGIGTITVPKRSYPESQLAGQVVGFVNLDGRGIAGLEQQFDAQLAGTPGERTIELGEGGQPIAHGEQTLVVPVPGADLMTTLDPELQYYTEMALKEAVEVNHADGGTVIVMDPATGEILAMATYPWFDPNRFGGYETERFRNRALTDAFEPGSVNKVITAAAAVEEGVVPEGMRFVVPDHLSIGGYTIHDSHPHATERMMLGDIIAESSNIGAVKVAQLVGERSMAEYLARFGFGATTGTGFPGETAGIVPALWQWSDSSLATIAYGQGVSVTPMQMASVYATIANGGTWVQPKLVLGTVGVNGQLAAADTATSRRVVSRETASTVTEMLAYVVRNGTGLEAQIRGYQVAGKTGTALKVDPATGHYTDRYVASFIGFLPASHPQVVVAAILDEPTTIYGGIAAAPLFQRVARYSIERLQIAPAPPVNLPPHLLRDDER